MGADRRSLRRTGNLDAPSSKLGCLGNGRSNAELPAANTVSDGQRAEAPLYKFR